MGFSLDNQVLLYIIIALFIVQFLVMRYYVQTTVDDDLSQNNKTLVKKLSKQISSTFDQYMGSGNGMPAHAGRHGQAMDPREMAMREQMYREEMAMRESGGRGRRSGRHEEREPVHDDIDSVDDPAEDDEDEDEQSEE